MLILVICLIGCIEQMSKYVSARFCEGGHICSLPRECCTQGCCPPYQNGPRQLPAATDHVLNLFFISHWFFWCVVVAVILAILCAYSLWKKRRTLCGWGFSDQHAGSEGDSTGSCYAPPQYSRCNSFIRPPPPYAEVTSKPDLYPLVYTFNGDNSKNGSNYLMVQYFRNYIVRPMGSLSAASTVDSLSSSFICNINEANTLVPPPYSRAASPEIGFGSHVMHHYMLPRSASQIACQNLMNTLNINTGDINTYYNNKAQQHQSRNYANGIVNATAGQTVSISRADAEYIRSYSTNTSQSQRTPFYDNEPNNLTNTANNPTNGTVITNNDLRTLTNRNNNGFVQSQSDQHFQQTANSNGSISDIFVNNSCTSEIIYQVNSAQHSENNSLDASASAAINGSTTLGDTTDTANVKHGKPKVLQRANTNPTQFTSETPRDPAFYSNNSMDGLCVNAVTNEDSAKSIKCATYELNDLQALRRSLETCCQLLQKQQKLSAESFDADASCPANGSTNLRKYLTSTTCSGVSSLSNIGAFSSPPQATSPTMEVKEILDQIRQLQEGVFKYEEGLNLRSSRAKLEPTTSSLPTATIKDVTCSLSKINDNKQCRNSTSNHQNAIVTSQSNPLNKIPSSCTLITTTNRFSKNKPSSILLSSSKRPSNLQQNRKLFYSSKLSTSKGNYTPITASNSTLTTTANRCILKSPINNIVNSNFFINRTSRARKSWISRSAPTTPAAPTPPNCFGDDSPLLHEHDEDQEGEQSAELD